MGAPVGVSLRLKGSEKDMAVLRIGIVGTGQMAATMLAAMRLNPNLSVVAACSHTQERARLFALRFGLEGGYDDLKVFCGTARIDAVYIANSNTDHADTARVCLEAGLPVFIEKPMALSVSDVRDIHSLAERKSLFVLENIWILALPAYRVLKEKLQTHGYGPPVRLAFDFSLPISESALPSLFSHPGGGVLFDRAGYGVSVALDLLGPASDLSAVVTRNNQGIDLSADLHVTHDTGARSNITVSFETAGRNDLSVATPKAFFQLTSGLAAEHLNIVTHSTPNGAGPDPIEPSSVTGRLKKRLKTAPFLRRAQYKKSTLSGPFYSYGKTPYAPILQELVRGLRTGRITSDVVPTTLSLSVAELLDKVREKSG